MNLMRINRLGVGFLKISCSPNKKETVDILINFSGEGELEKLRAKADILLLTNPKPETAVLKKEHFLINCPGEYEVKGVFIRGMGILKGKQGPGTIYTLDAEDMRICYFGLIGQEELSEEQVDELGAVDILIVPISPVRNTISNGVSEKQYLSPKQASKIISQIEPRVVAVIKGEDKKSEAGLKEFLKEMGEKEPEKAEELNIKQKDLKEEETKIFVLS